VRGSVTRVRRWLGGSSRLGQALIEAVPPFDVYNRRALTACLGTIGAISLAWSPRDAEVGDLGAARFALGLLRENRALRRRFPRGIREGGGGSYCHWLCTQGLVRYGLSAPAGRHLQAAFARRLGDRIWDVYYRRVDVRRAFPLAVTPFGLSQFLEWLLVCGKAGYTFLDEEIWWFLHECGEDPSKGVAITYLLNPEWQEKFPLGMTVFGRRQLLDWLRERFGVDPRWLRQGALPPLLRPADELRLLYGAGGLPVVDPQVPWERQDPNRLVRWLQGKGRKLAPLDGCWWQRLRDDLARGLLEQPGVNVLGHFSYPSGLQVVVQTLVRALHQAGVRTACRDVPVEAPNHLSRSPPLDLELFNCTLIHLQPEPYLETCYARSGLAPRPGVYRIGVWYWESETAPPAWAQLGSCLQEVWAPSRFVAEALRRILSIPVVHMPVGLAIGSVAPVGRAYFGLPTDKFLFLFMFDMYSIMERKNPLGVIRAFRHAFRPNEPVALVLKVSNGAANRENLGRLVEAARSAGVTVIDRLLSREDSYALLGACDCYVSLHRAEGLGLTLAEAMLLGKPVIATGYSGNLDFMTPANSLLVEHERVAVTEDLPVYSKGSVWAEPSTAHAAQCMRWVYEHPEEARALGSRARVEAGAALSVEAAGRRMAQRLRDIQTGMAATSMSAGAA
jgi:glycosyltransferase involved in cell wall biosynthesis